MLKPQGLRKRHHWGYLFAGIIVLIIAAFILMPRYAWLHAAGPMNTGHEDLVCEDCHQPAAGSLRQELQANVQFVLGNRSHPAQVGFRPVTNRDCQHCHDRPSDRHPVSRFLEPRFTKARAAIAPHKCASCHREHQGKRVTTVSQGYCSNCHQKLKLRKEKINVAHAELVKQKRWQTCMGCHDFHGNHRMNVRTRLENIINEKQIQDYFNGGDDPYSDKKIHKAKQGGKND